jgi:superkiller protein 3
VPVRYALGVVLADRPEAHTRALELLQTAASAGFEVTEASYLIGRVFADQGEFEKAVVAFERTLALAPDHLDAHYRLANALVRLGRRDEAAPIMARFAELQQQFNAREARDKQVKTARNELAAALAARDGAAAAAAVDRMYALAADDPDVLVAATKVWMSAGRVAEAFDAAEAASQLDPDHWEANYLYGLLLVREGRAELALAALQRAIDANPLFAGSYVLAGNALMQLGAAESAVGSYLAAIDLEADNPGSWLNLASAYGALGRRDRQREAEAEYQRLVRARDSSAQQ